MTTKLEQQFEQVALEALVEEFDQDFIEDSKETVYNMPDVLLGPNQFELSELWHQYYELSDEYREVEERLTRACTAMDEIENLARNINCLCMTTWKLNVGNFV